MMDYYRLTGESKFIAGIPAAIDFLELVRLPESNIEKYGRPNRGGWDAFVPRFVDPDTGKPLYVHREGTNVANGYYFVNQDISNIIGHYGSAAFIHIGEIRKAYERIKNTPVEELTKESPLLQPRNIPLETYYTQMPRLSGDLDKEAAEMGRDLTKDGYWLTPLTMVSNPYKECPPMAPSREIKYGDTFVGDEYDTSCYRSETPVMGISMAVYVANMSKLIQYIDK